MEESKQIINENNIDKLRQTENVDEPCTSKSIREFDNSESDEDCSFFDNSDSSDDTITDNDSCSSSEDDADDTEDDDDEDEDEDHKPKKFDFTITKADEKIEKMDVDNLTDEEIKIMIDRDKDFFNDFLIDFVREALVIILFYILNLNFIS